MEAIVKWKIRINDSYVMPAFHSHFFSVCCCYLLFIFLFNNVTVKVQFKWQNHGPVHKCVDLNSLIESRLLLRLLLPSVACSTISVWRVVLHTFKNREWNETAILVHRPLNACRRRDCNRISLMIVLWNVCVCVCQRQCEWLKCMFYM